VRSRDAVVIANEGVEVDGYLAIETSAEVNRR
jgi:hypothetical protein